MPEEGSLEDELRKLRKQSGFEDKLRKLKKSGLENKLRELMKEIKSNDKSSQPYVKSKPNLRDVFKNYLKALSEAEPFDIEHVCKNYSKEFPNDEKIRLHMLAAESLEKPDLYENAQAVWAYILIQEPNAIQIAAKDGNVEAVKSLYLVSKKIKVRDFAPIKDKIHPSFFPWLEEKLAKGLGEAEEIKNDFLYFVECMDTDYQTVERVFETVIFNPKQIIFP